MARQNFSSAIRDRLAKRVAYRCSNPVCRTLTVGPHTEPTGIVNVGVAAHVRAASAGGPRYDKSQSKEERRSIENAIWLCQTCAKLIDSDISAYGSNQILRWKISAEAETMRDVGAKGIEDYLPQPAGAIHAPIPRIEGLLYEEARDRLVRAGWQPALHHWSHGSSLDISYGNGPYFWEKGFHEIIHSFGTGLGFCTFAFRDAYQNQLIVQTAGEVIEEIDAHAHVWSWHFDVTEPGT